MLVESTPDVLRNFVLIFHWDDAWLNRSNWMIELGGQIGQIGWKSIEIMSGRIGWSNWVQIHWDYILCLPGWIGQIGWTSIEITLYVWSNWVDIHWDYIVCLVKSVELGGNPLRWCLVKLGIISMDFYPIWPPNLTRHNLNGFPPNWTNLTCN